MTLTFREPQQDGDQAGVPHPGGEVQRRAAQPVHAVPVRALGTQAGDDDEGMYADAELITVLLS